MRPWMVYGAVGLAIAALFVVGMMWLDGSPSGSASQAPSRLTAAEVAQVGGVVGDQPTFYGGVLNPPRPAPEFSLMDQHRQPFRLQDHRGKVVVLFFGYTTCPDVCPGTLAHYTRVKELLADDADRVEFVFITVDPERDTPERLAEYMPIFDEEFYGLTGDREALEAVWSDYGVYVERVEDPGPVGYWMNHTALSYVIDPDGRLRLAHMYGTPVEEVASDLRQLL